MARPKWLEGPILVIDTETTGLDWTRDEVIQLGAVLRIDGETFKFQELSRPSISIPSAVSAVHHITDELVKYAAPISEVLDHFRDWFEDAGGGWTNVIVAGYNTLFDQRMLAAAYLRSGKPRMPIFAMPNDASRWLDVLVAARHCQPYAPGTGRFKLSNTYKRLFGFEFSGVHSALSDCEATLAVLDMLVGEFPKKFDYDAFDYYLQVQQMLRERYNYECLEFLLYKNNM